MSDRVKEIEDELEEARNERDMLDIRIEALEADLRRARAIAD